MFQAQRLVFYSCLSPVHMGAGSAVGAIDNPIQREVHTQHPMLAGSGIKGAARHRLAHEWSDPDLLRRIFGPERDASDHAGAVAFTDAQVVAFPVRSARKTYVYATCPTALARLKRLAGQDAGWSVPKLAAPASTGDLAAMMVGTGSDSAASQGRLALEAFDFAAQPSAELKAVADWLAHRALPRGAEHDYFRSKLATDLVLLGDTEFAHFVRHATVVEAHVRIHDERGTADPGGLFYTENLPPETLLAGLVLASVERRSKKAQGDRPLIGPAEVLDHVLQGVDGRPGLTSGPLQVGGDATTGRGLIAVSTTAGT
jgi:CRISPR-associated protein Cmr4